MNTQYEELTEAVRGLPDAVKVLLKPTFPPTPLPRPKIFRFGPFTWPYINNDQEWRFENVAKEGGKYSIYDSPQFFVNHMLVLGDPQSTKEALRALRAATAWCYARAAGRQRAAKNKMSQENKARDRLEAEAALLALRK